MYIFGLSGGQKQRLAIASALASRPGILVLDEPASALDPEGAEELYALLARLNIEAGITLLVVEHDLAKALAYADRLVVLAGGRVVYDGGVRVLFAGGVAVGDWGLRELAAGA